MYAADRIVCYSAYMNPRCLNFDYEDKILFIPDSISIETFLLLLPSLPVLYE